MAIFFPAISGADPWIASNKAKSLPIFADPARPTDPEISAVTSEIISPKRLEVTITSKISGLVASLAVHISTI